MKFPFVVGLLLSFAWSGVMAQVSVKNPWVRATVAQQKATGAFMQLTSGTSARLVEAQSPVAGVVEIHEMSMANNVMRMRAIAGLDLPAGKTVELKPGGYHVMLMDLKAPISAGQEVPLTLVFEHADRKRESVVVRATARGLGEASGHDGHTH